MKKKKIIISLSSGIDSTTVLLLLKKNGFYIECIYMQNWENINECTYEKDLKYIKNICKKFKVKLNLINLSKKYWNNVFLTFLKHLKKGFTPNPDILCNEKIKFNFLFNYIKNKLNFNFLSTGHYAKLSKIKKSISLILSFNLEKDQTYFLAKIKKQNFANILFPINNYLKTDIKLILKNLKTINCNKKTSTGICFIENSNFKKFIQNYLTNTHGNIIDNKNNILKNHNGLHFYTLGEKINIKNQKFYIYKKNIKTKTLYVIKTQSSTLTNKLNINTKNSKNNKIIYNAKIRHNKQTELCYIKNKTVIFKKKISIISPGQYLVFYKKNLCLGCKMIT